MEPYPDLILANRAYLDHSTPWGTPLPPTGSGGLLEAVRPVIRRWDGERGTTWIGAGRGSHDREWVDTDGRELIPTDAGDLRHRRLFFDNDTWDRHYGDYANGFLWPLLHLVRLPLQEIVDYYPRPVAPSAAATKAFRTVNEAFASAAMEETHGGECWVHDYQLSLVPDALRTRGFGGRIGFFLHTPFPDVDLLARCLDGVGMDVFRDCLAGILGADLVGLQTEGDVRRLMAAAGQFLGAKPEGESLSLKDGRRVCVGAYPVGIDTEAIVGVAREAQLPPEVAALKRDGLPLVVALERADYTKGIPERLEAVAAAMRGGARFAYAGIASPTREGVAAYEKLGRAVETAASTARAAAAEHGLPFLHLHEAISWPEVVAMLREADVLFTSSLADGMNLVPHQCVMAQSEQALERRGVILAGRDAGVSATFAGMEKEGLVPVDATEPESMIAALVAALAGLPGRAGDTLVAEVRRRDARAWGARFMDDLTANIDA